MLSKTGNGKQTEVGLKVVKLHDALSKHYNMPDVHTFAAGLTDKDRAGKAYDALSANYNMPDKQEFLIDLGFPKDQSWLSKFGLYSQQVGADEAAGKAKAFQTPIPISGLVPDTWTAQEGKAGNIWTGVNSALQVAEVLTTPFNAFLLLAPFASWGIAGRILTGIFAGEMVYGTVGETKEAFKAWDEAKETGDWKPFIDHTTKAVGHGALATTAAIHTGKGIVKDVKVSKAGKLHAKIQEQIKDFNTKLDSEGVIPGDSRHNIENKLIKLHMQSAAAKAQMVRDAKTGSKMEKAVEQDKAESMMLETLSGEISKDLHIAKDIVGRNPKNQAAQARVESLTKALDEHTNKLGTIRNKYKDAVLPEQAVKQEPQGMVTKEFVTELTNALKEETVRTPPAELKARTAAMSEALDNLDYGRKTLSIDYVRWAEEAFTKADKAYTAKLKPPSGVEKTKTPRAMEVKPRYLEYVPDKAQAPIEIIKAGNDAKIQRQFNRETDKLFTEGLYKDQASVIISKGKLIFDKPISEKAEIFIVGDKANIQQAVNPIRKTDVVYEPVHIYDVKGNVAATVLPNPPNPLGFFRNTTEALMHTAKGLVELTKPRGDILASGLPLISEAGYVKAKPYFEQAWRSYGRAGKDIKEFAKDMKASLPDNYTPLVARFIVDLQKADVAFSARLDLNDLASAADRKFKANRHMLEENRKIGFKTVKAKTIRSLWDMSGNIDASLKKAGAAGERAMMEHSLTRGSSGNAKRIYEDVFADVFKGLSKEDRTLLDQYNVHKRVVAIDAYQPGRIYFKGTNALESRAYIETFSQKYPGKASDIVARSDKYFEHTKKFGIDVLREETVINREAYDAMTAIGPYLPMNYIKYIKPYDFMTVGGKKISVKDNTIRTLTEEGGSGIIETDTALLLKQVINRVQNVVFDNRANRALMNFASAVPGNDIVRIAKPFGYTKGGEPLWSPPRQGWDYIGLHTDGKQQNLLMKSEFAKEWIRNDPDISHWFIQCFSWLSGAKPLKATATGYNPGFGLFNLPRDFQHIWWTPEGAKEYSNFIPKAIGQQLHDYKVTAKDAWNGTGRWTDMVEKGVSMEWLTQQGQLAKNPTGKFATFQKAAGKIGQFTEVWTRMALYERAMKNRIRGDMTPAEIATAKLESTFQARNYLDFAKGGSIVKAADVVLPYLSAGVQGARGSIRLLHERPGMFAYKAAQYVATAAGVSAAAWSLYPDAMKDVSPYDLENNIVFPLFGTYYIDKEGNKVYYYMRLPVDQSARPFHYIAQGMAAGLQNRDFEWDRFDNVMAQAVPLIPSSVVSPTVNAVIGYKYNLDMFRGQPIWKGRDVFNKRPELEVDKEDHPIVKWVAENVKGISAKRAAYMVDQIVAPTNTFTLALGGTTKLLLDDMDWDTKKFVMEDVLLDIGRVVKTTTPNLQSYKQARELVEDESVERQLQDMEFEELFDKYYENQTGENLIPLLQMIANAPFVDRDRLRMKFKQTVYMQNIPNRDWWLSTVGKSTRIRAALLATKIKEADKDEAAKLIRTAKEVPGYMSDEFLIYLEDELRKR